MRVLIADDHAHSCRLMASLLRHWEFDPFTVADGDAALGVLNGPDPPRLALLDWIMPGLDGIDVCRAIRAQKDRPYTYVILVTGRSSKEEMLAGLEAGADDYLVKPADPQELRLRLNTGRRILMLQEELLATQRLLREQATRDGLTSLWNRAMILEILERELARSAREGSPVGVIMADIDHFKSINDRHGHLVGDQVLREVGQRLHAVVRPYDTVGRYGGEEFLIVLPGCAPAAAAALAERLRHCIDAEPVVVEGLTVPVTLSLGVAAVVRVGTAVDLLRVADEALYRAKGAGRNRACAASINVAS